MDNLVKEYIETGKDVNTILNNRIKANNRKWFLILCLFSIVWIGYAISVNKRLEAKIIENNNLLKICR